MDIIQKKCDKIKHNIIQREMDRKLEVEKRRVDKMQNMAEHEQIEFFQETFAEKRLEIENALNSLESINPSELSTHFDIISKNILNLQKFAANSKLFLRVYDVQKCHQIVQELTVQAKELEEKLLPKKKFGFKNKNKPGPRAKETRLNGHTRDEVDFCKKSLVNLNENFCGYENRKNESLILQNSKIFKKDVTIKNLENCTVKIYGSPSTLILNDLKNCAIFSGPISTSVFAENCSDCKLIIACQQLRLHSSRNIHIYLHVTSRAIMEDCEKVLLAPYNFKYEGIEKDFDNSGLNVNINNWTSIDDFNWLNTEIHSPNWDVLNEKDRILDWNSFYLPAG